MKNSMNSSNLKQEKYWSSFADHYFKTLYKDVKEYPSLIVRHNYILDLLNSDGRLIADIGCGPGEMIADLMDRDCKVYGVDIAEGMLQVAARNISERHPHCPADLQCGNIEALHYKDNIFDGVVCAGVIEYLNSDDKALRELNRILKINGMLIISVRNKACPFRIFDLLLDKIKKIKIGLRFLNALRKVAKKDPIKYISYRKHFPWELERNLVKHGFIKQDFRYFHFYPFFTPFDHFFPALFVKLGLKMERLSHTRLGFLGSGYIVKAKKVQEV